MTGGETWAVVWMPPRYTLPFLDMVQELPWLEGWTPVQRDKVKLPDGREIEKARPMLPGMCFVPAGLLNASLSDAQDAGIHGARPALHNDFIMLLEESELAGLRQAEIDYNLKPELREEQASKLAIGMTVSVAGGAAAGLTGVIKRLESDLAHIEVSGSTSRLVVRRYLLQETAA